MEKVSHRVDPDALCYDERGLVTVVAQEVVSSAVLMVAFANREAIEATMRTGRAHFFSRSRQSLWRKGQTSGNELVVNEVLADCDGDAILYRVRATGSACHTGERTCFGEPIARLELGWLSAVLAGRRSADPLTSYTARLLKAGVSRSAQKVGEEATEVVIAAVSAAAARGGEASAARVRFVEESADLIYHWLVLALALGVPIEQLADELQQRHVELTAEEVP